MSVWVRDHSTEAFLRGLGIPFEEASIPMSKIDRDEGLRRQARMHGNTLIEKWAFEVGCAFEKGQDANVKRIILQKVKGGTYWAIDGNHRLAGAFMMGIESVDAYVVDIRDPRTIDIAKITCNTTLTGHGLETEERVQNAQMLHEKHGVPIAQAAKLVGVSDQLLYTSARADQCKKKLDDLGVKGQYTKSILIDLYKIKDDEVLKSTTELIRRYKIKGDTAAQIVTEVREKTNQGSQLAEVNRWEKIYLDMNKPKKSKAIIPYKEKNRGKFLKWLTQGAKMLKEHDTIEKLQLVDPADLQVAKKYSKEVVLPLIRLFDSKNTDNGGV